MNLWNSSPIWFSSLPCNKQYRRVRKVTGITSRGKPRACLKCLSAVWPWDYVPRPQHIGLYTLEGWWMLKLNMPSCYAQLELCLSVIFEQWIPTPHPRWDIQLTRRHLRLPPLLAAALSGCGHLGKPRVGSGAGRLSLEGVVPVVGINKRQKCFQTYIKYEIDTFCNHNSWLPRFVQQKLVCWFFFAATEGPFFKAPFVRCACPSATSCWRRIWTSTLRDLGNGTVPWGFQRSTPFKYNPNMKWSTNIQVNL